MLWKAYFISFAEPFCNWASGSVIFIARIERVADLKKLCSSEAIACFC